MARRQPKLFSSGCIHRGAYAVSNKLFQAIGQHDVKSVAGLLLEGDDPNAPQTEFPNWRPLEAAIEELGSGAPVEVVRLLIRHGADVNAWDLSDSLTPLHRGMFHENEETIRLLLEAGADPNPMSNEGDSALRLAVEQGNLEMAALCLRYGASQTINESGGFCGNTVLGLAALKLSLPMIELLLKAGADPEALDSDDLTAKEHLPPRERSSPKKWEKAIELLSRAKS